MDIYSRIVELFCSLVLIAIGIGVFLRSLQLHLELEMTGKKMDLMRAFRLERRALQLFYSGIGSFVFGVMFLIFALFV